VVAHDHPRGLRAGRGDDSGELVAEHHRQRGAEVGLGEAEVGVAQPHGPHVDEDLATARDVDDELLDVEAAPDRGDDGGPHGAAGANR